MSFFAALLMDADVNPYQEIKAMLDPGQYSLPTGRHTVNKNGMEIMYGPVLSFDLAIDDNAAVMTFAGNRPQASVGCKTYATIYALTFTPDGKTEARGSYLGGAFRRRVMTVEE